MSLALLQQTGSRGACKEDSLALWAARQRVTGRSKNRRTICKGDESERIQSLRRFEVGNRKLADGLYARNALALGAVQLVGYSEVIH